ncbi:acyltransferase domain-containing protein [Lentzea sp. NPDC042327]|uniref:acyltransferase domain-containing protein n=1 Tax=Lentzea sp. NPDC042327 TaxID=3154801 RepID=UPI0033D01BB2
MKTAFVFPGLGSLFTDPFAHYAAGRRHAAELASRIDAVTADLGWPSVLSEPEPTAWSPLSEMQTYHAQLSCHRVLLEEFGLRPDVLLGHSLGEITAMVAAEGITVEDGARLLCERAKALQAHANADAATAAFMLSSCQAAAVVAGARSVVVAAVNSPTQVILSGPAEEVERLAHHARAQGTTVTALRAGPYAQHHVTLGPAFERYLESVRGIRSAPLKTAVWSPVLGRAVGADDDLVLLAALQMVRPLDFCHAVTELSSEGVAEFVECGLKDTLTRLVSETLGSRARVWAPFRKRVTETDVRQLTTLLTSPRESAMTSSDDVVTTYLRESYAAALEIPEDMVTPDVDLEAEFGLDSLQHHLVLVKAQQRWSVELGQVESPATITVRTVAQLLKDAGAARETA